MTIKGIGREVISKLCGVIADFGRYYEVGHPLIPSEIQREPEEFVYLDEEQNEVAGFGIWVAGIERLTLPSKQRVFLGHAPRIKKKRGEKHSYSAVQWERCCYGELAPALSGRTVVMRMNIIPIRIT